MFNLRLPIKIICTLTLMSKEKKCTKTPDLKILNVTADWDAIWELIWPDS